MKNAFRNACFSFVMSEGEIVNPFSNVIVIGDYYFAHDSNTPVCRSSLDEREVILFGLAVDIRNGIENDIADRVLREAKSIEEVIDFEKWLGGKYLIIYKDDTGCYVVPDATASVPVLYTRSGSRFFCSSYEMSIVESLQLKEDPALQKIRKASDISQAMPFDTTCYKEIRALLPNHFLNCKEQNAIRFVNTKVKQSEISVDEAVEITAPYIEKIAAFYASKYKLYCPLTGGRDSRVVLAYLLQACKRNNEDLLCYTIRHAQHSGAEDDLIIPERLSKLELFSYEQIQDEEVSADIQAKFDLVFGKNRYSPRTLMIADTIYKHYGDGAIVNGDIIGQVGKCSLHRDIPEFLASPNYFRCKLHNYARESIKYIKKWMREISAAGEQINVFDMFSVENRLGRWAAQENSIYNILGQLYLNIFNSRSIIYTWACVERKYRKKADIQRRFIDGLFPELLQEPFEKDKTILIRMSKSNGLSYYFASQIKHFLGFLKYTVVGKE